MSRESKRDEADFAQADSCRSGRSTPRSLQAFFETYSLRLTKCSETLFMQCKIFYRCYKFLEARTFPSDGTLIVATGAARRTGPVRPIRTAVQIPVPRLGPVLNGNIL